MTSPALSWPRSPGRPTPPWRPSASYTWLTSYVAGDKISCLHEADDAETIRARPPREVPADVVSVVANEFGPGTAGQDAPARNDLDTSR